MPWPNRCRHLGRVIAPDRRGAFVRSRRLACRRWKWRRHRLRRAAVRPVGSRRVTALCARYPPVPERPRLWEAAVPAGCRRSSAWVAPKSRSRRWQPGQAALGCVDRSSPRAHRPRVRARPVQTPGGRSSGPTSGRSLLKVAPSNGAGGIPRAAPLGLASPVRSGSLPRLNARAGSLPSRSRGPAKDWETVCSVTAKKT